MPEQMLTLAVWNILAACCCIVFLVYFLLEGRRLRREADEAAARVAELAEKARLYDEMQEKLAKIGTLVDARKAAAKAGRVRIEAEGYALEWETNGGPDA